MVRIVLAALCVATLTSAGMALGKSTEQEVSLFDQQIVGPTRSEAEVGLCEWSEMGGLRLPEIVKQTFCEPQYELPADSSSNKGLQPQGGD